MDNEQLKKHYSLTDDQVNAVGGKTAKKITSKLSSPDNPKIIFTGGQAGAGKSNVTDLIKSQLKSDVAIIDSDIYRAYHPKSEEIQRKYPEIASNLTHQAGARIGNKVRDAALEKGTNILFDQTSRTPQGIKIIGERAAESKHNYTSELHVIATDKDTSTMRVHQRYENGGGHKGGRYVDSEFQTLSYNGVEDTIKEIEDTKAVDKIVVYDRYSKPIYENTVKNGEWLNKPGAHKTLVSQRNQELTATEKNELQNGWQKIQVQMQERQAEINDPKIHEVAKKEIDNACKKFGITVKEAEAAKPGRTYTGVVIGNTNKSVIQKTQTGRIITHSKTDLPGTRFTRQDKPIKIAYSNNKASVIDESSNQHSKEIKNQYGLE